MISAPGSHDQTCNRRSTIPTFLAVAAVVSVAASVIALAAAGPAAARQSDMRAARTQYPGIVGSRIDNCALCHVSESNFRLDSYGSDYGQSGGDFAAIEIRDSDGDGYSNIAEITALTYPGKADSVPSPGPSTTPSAEPTATATMEPTSPPTAEPTLTPATPEPTATIGGSATPETPPPAAFLPVAWRR